MALVDAQWGDTATLVSSWSAGWQHPALVLLPPGGISSPASACASTLTVASAAFYCGRDDTVYLSADWLQSVARGGGTDAAGDGATATGDAGVLFVIGHEVAHAWVRQLGWSSGEVTQDEELFADCFAGAVVASLAEPTGGVDPGTARAVAGLAFSLGSDHVDDPDWHGTGAQRRQAALQGLDGADHVTLRGAPALDVRDGVPAATPGG